MANHEVWSLPRARRFGAYYERLAKSHSLFSFDIQYPLFDILCKIQTTQFQAITVKLLGSLLGEKGTDFADSLNP